MLCPLQAPKENGESERLAPARRTNDFSRAVSRILSALLSERRGSFVSAATTRNWFHQGGTEAGHFAVSYLALHRMRFSVPPRLLLGRWALTPPFHPYPALSDLSASLGSRPRPERVR